MGKLLLLTVASLITINTTLVAQAADSKTLYAVTSRISGFKKLDISGKSQIRAGIDQIVEAHNARFEANGKLMAGDPRGSAFVQTQEGVLADLKARGALTLMTSIKNNLIKDLDTNVFLILDEAKVPLALAFEYRKYDEDTRKNLRVRPLQNLVVNNTIQEIEGVPSVALSSTTGDFSKGGEVLIICLTDLKKKKYHSVTVKINKDMSGAWGLFQNLVKVTDVKLTLWLSILTGNGGIKTLNINSKVDVPLVPFN